MTHRRNSVSHPYQNAEQCKTKMRTNSHRVNGYKKLQEFQDYKIRDHYIRKFLSIQILDKVLQQRLLGFGPMERKSVD